MSRKPRAPFRTKPAVATGGHPTAADLRGLAPNLSIGMSSEDYVRVIREMGEYVVLSNDMWRVIACARDVLDAWDHPVVNDGDAGRAIAGLRAAVDHYFELYPEHQSRP